MPSSERWSLLKPLCLLSHKFVYTSAGEVYLFFLIIIFVLF